MQWNGRRIVPVSLHTAPAASVSVLIRRHGRVTAPSPPSRPPPGGRARARVGADGGCTLTRCRVRAMAVREDGVSSVTGRHADSGSAQQEWVARPPPSVRRSGRGCRRAGSVDRVRVVPVTLADRLRAPGEERLLERSSTRQCGTPTVGEPYSNRCSNAAARTYTESSWPTPSSPTSRPSTTPATGTPRSATSAPPTTRPIGIDSSPPRQHDHPAPLTDTVPVTGGTPPLPVRTTGLRCAAWPSTSPPCCRPGSCTCAPSAGAPRR